ncbi:UvrD-helicase domain-containing protein [Ampullimonas aquatilis]|uniref:UvrD-helicase domain-containing protein n=1 Tax=Ampullimonas aquatilis TaxID=1341549 RepID=UPI003C764CFD
MTEPVNLIDAVTDDDVDWICQLMKLRPLDVPRQEFLKSLATVDVSACPGSGKTTLVVAKLAILARKWTSNTRGICVLSHTNVAREEIEHRLGSTDVGQRLLSYPHFIDTIHGFVNRFLATPWLLSAGYRVAAIDNDLTTRVRRRHLGEKDYRRLNSYLEKKFRSFDGLRIGTADFAAPLADGAFPDGPHTDMYKLAASALRYAAEQGYFCYDEIFVLGEALLTQQPALPSILQQRFPFVLIDEMQDTSEQQNNFLRRLFPRASNAVCVQRVGDPNQAIFEGGIQPVVDAFPDPANCLGIADSFRFDTSIAALATPFAYLPVQPAGLNGIRVTDVPGQGLPHTIFVFPDNDTSAVLDAFGRHVLATLPPALIETSAITAIGAVHKLFEDVGSDHKHYPKTVAHYWAGYQPGASRQAYRPRTLAEYILAAQAVAQSGGPLYQCVDSVAFGMTHLANLLAGTTQLKARRRQHLQIEDRLSIADEARAIYRSVLTRFLTDREALTRTSWITLCPSLKLLGATLGGGDASSAAANDFLAWRETMHLPQHTDQYQVNAATPNSYRCSHGGASVDIQLSSIHVAKGQTHSATLVLETFYLSHFLHGLMPWLLGKHQNGTRCTTDKAAQRLLQMYVAMTRPTHLLCLALRKGSLGTGNAYSSNQEKLIASGWRIQHLSAPAAAGDD